MSRPIKRPCPQCGKANKTIYPVCNSCRQSICDHMEKWHYNDTHSKVCQCGLVLTTRLKKVGFDPKERGVFPGAMMSQYRAEDLA